MNTNKRRMMMMSERDQHPPEKNKKTDFRFLEMGASLFFVSFVLFFREKLKQMRPASSSTL
jgi:hypothetical protein